MEDAFEYQYRKSLKDLQQKINKALGHDHSDGSCCIQTIPELAEFYISGIPYRKVKSP